MHRSICLLFLLSACAVVRGQDASLADADLDFSRGIIQHFHLAARVALELKENQYTNYQYDHYPLDGPYHGAERIKADEGVFARKPGGAWLKSDDWGETGKPADANLIDELNTYVQIANIPFEKPENLDLKQGKNVWKFIEKETKQDTTYYTYEQSREHPHPNGVYPRYTFMKAPHDVDGKLFPVLATGQLRSGDDRIPFSIGYIYLIPMPPGTKVKVYDQVTKKEKYETVVDKNSGWEVTTPQSAPPTDSTSFQLPENVTVQDIAPGQNGSTNAAPPAGAK